MIPTLWNTVKRTLVLGTMLAVSVGGVIVCGWWFFPLFWLGVSFTGGLIQLTKGKGRV